MNSFKNDTILGVKWSIVGRLGHNLISFVVGVYLARLLSPTEFGLIGMITVITGFATLFTELGFGSALIQKKEITREELSSVFWLNMGGGTILTALFFLCAPFLASFYGTPQLEILTKVLAFNFFIKSLNIIQNTLFYRSLDFKSISLVEVGAQLLAGICAIIMAYNDFGVWSLVTLSLIGSSSTAAILWFLSSWRPSFYFSFESVKGLMNFSLNLLGTRSLSYWTRSLDDLLLGKYYGSDALGIYTKAYSIMLFPLQNISRVISRVMFPALSQIQDDKARVKKIFLKMTRVIALCTFPMMFGLFVVADSFVIVVFGGQWSAMIPILRIFCFIGMSQSIGTLVGNIYLSQGRADLQFKIGLFLKSVVFTGIVVGLQWGAIGVAAGYAVAVTFNSYPIIRFAGKLIGLTYSTVVKNLRSIFFISLVMAGIVFLSKFLLPENWPLWVLLITQITIGVTVYLIMIHIFKVKAYLEMRSLILEELKS